jgi:hypothetical protein
LNGHENGISALEAMMSRLDVEPSKFKSTVASMVEVVGRLKRNGRLLRYSPSSRVVELEALAAGIVTRRNLWRARCAAAQRETALDVDELDELIERATSQFERAIDAHERAAAEAFGPAARPAAGAAASGVIAARRTPGTSCSIMIGTSAAGGRRGDDRGRVAA